MSLQCQYVVYLYAYLYALFIFIYFWGGGSFIFFQIFDDKLEWSEKLQYGNKDVVNFAIYSKK